MFTLMNDLPLALILFLASTAAASPSSSIQDSPQQHPKAAAATAMKMLPAMKMKLSPANQRPIETDYFKPKEYTSKDFPRLVEGLGQQISRDLEKAHFAMAAQAEQVRQVQERLERLERILPATPETAADGYWPPNMFLAVLCSVLMFALGLLLAAHCFLLKHLLRNRHSGTTKHIRLANNCSDQEQI